MHGAGTGFMRDMREEEVSVGGGGDIDGGQG